VSPGADGLYLPSTIERIWHKKIGPARNRELDRGPAPEAIFADFRTVPGNPDKPTGYTPMNMRDESVSAPHGDGESPRPSRLMLLALVPMAGFVLCLRSLAAGDIPWEIEWTWIPSLGVDLGLRVDGLSLQFLLLITGIGALVFLYAASYMASDARRVRLFALLSVFMAAMIGCVTADNLVALFVFWELTSLTSFLLVGFKHEYEASRAAARQALMVTGGGGLVLLAGIVLIGEAAGTYSIQSLIRASPDLLAHPSIPMALAFVFVGAFTKSAQWPFHFWLPNAMAAPTPVSAYLHSATMVKLGVYLLARLKPAFGEHWLWEPALVSVGALTAAWAMLLALRERDMKRILAWSTVSAARARRFCTRYGCTGRTAPMSMPAAGRRWRRACGFSCRGPWAPS